MARATVKKTTAKKAPAKKTTRKKAPAKKRGQPEVRSREERLAAVEAVLNKKGQPPMISRASEYEASYLLRRPTGILSLDLLLAGGFPASAPVMITGPDGAGKDYLLLRTAAEAQRLYGDEFAMALYQTEFRLDKQFARDVCGLRVPMTPEEIEEMEIARENAGKPPLTEEEIERYTEKVGTIHLIEGVNAEKGFDAIIECVKSNAYQIVAINSIGFLQTKAKTETDTYEEFAQRSSEAILLSKFMPDLSLTLNQLAEGVERNHTTVILIDQVRSAEAKKTFKRVQQDKDKHRPARDVWAVKHGIAIRLNIYPGKKHYDETNKEYVGRVTKWEITKGKLGTHDGLSGSFDFFYDGGADVVGDLLTVALDLEVIDKRGAHYHFDDPTTDLSFSAHGQHKARRELLNDEGLRDRIRYLCLRKQRVVYRYT